MPQCPTDLMTMELSTIIPHIEALIFASDKPLTSADIVELINNAFGFMEHRISIEQVDAAVEGIQEKYNAEFYPFEVRESGGGWQFLTKKEFHKTVGQLNGDKFKASFQCCIGNAGNHCVQATHYQRRSRGHSRS